MRRFVAIIHPPPFSVAKTKQDYLPINAFTVKFMRQLIGIPLTTDSHQNTVKAIVDTVNKHGVLDIELIKNQLTNLGARSSKCKMIHDHMKQNNIPINPTTLWETWQQTEDEGGGYGIIGTIANVYQDAKTREIKAVIEMDIHHMNAAQQKFLNTMIGPGCIWDSVSLTTNFDDATQTWTPLEVSVTDIPLRFGCTICPDTELETYTQNQPGLKMADAAPVVAMDTQEPAEGKTLPPRDPSTGRFVTANTEPRAMDIDEFRSLLKTLPEEQQAKLIGHEKARRAELDAASAEASKEVKLPPELEAKIATLEQIQQDAERAMKEANMTQENVNSTIMRLLGTHSNLLKIPESAKAGLIVNPQTSAASLNLITAALSARNIELENLVSGKIDDLESWYNREPRKRAIAHREPVTEEPPAKRPPLNVVTASKQTAAEPSLPPEYLQEIDPIQRMMQSFRETRKNQRL